MLEEIAISYTNIKHYYTFAFIQRLLHGTYQAKSDAANPIIWKMRSAICLTQSMSEWLLLANAGPRVMR